jgi:hypothetical protein
MGTYARSIGLIVASAGSAAVLALSGAPTAIGANSALFLNGLAAGELTPIVMSNILDGAFAGSGYTRTAVSWPAQAKPFTGKDSLSLTESVNIGVTNITAATNAALAGLGPGEHVTIVGLSAGALVADEYLRRLVDSGQPLPDKSQLNFVVVADGSRVWLNRDNYNRILDYRFQAPPQTKYDTTVVTGEYDGFADFPDRPWNVIADMNALAGTIVVHVPTVFADLSTVPASNISVTTNPLGGVTTNYLVPTATLPLVQLFPFLKSQEAALKKIVDAGYKRNDPLNGVQGAAAADTVASTVSVSASATAAPVVSTAAPVVTAPAEVSTPASQIAAPVVSAAKAAAAAPKSGGLGVASVAKGVKAGASRRSAGNPAEARSAAATRTASAS